MCVDSAVRGGGALGHDNGGRPDRALQAIVLRLRGCCRQREEPEPRDQRLHPRGRSQRRERHFRQVSTADCNNRIFMALRGDPAIFMLHREQVRLAILLVYSLSIRVDERRTARPCAVTARVSLEREGDLCECYGLLGVN